MLLLEQQVRMKSSKTEREANPSDGGNKHLKEKLDFERITGKVEDKR
jgi:hypothetical protein